MNEPRHEALLEAAATPYRERDVAGRLLPSPAFMDLPEEAREELEDLRSASREMERAFSPNRWSGTVRAVMDWID